MLHHDRPLEEDQPASFFAESADKVQVGFARWQLIHKTGKTCFDVSIPFRLICSTDGLLCLRSTTTSFWHNRCRRGPSTTPTADALVTARCRSAAPSPLRSLQWQSGHRPRAAPPARQRLSLLMAHRSLTPNLATVPVRPRHHVISAPVHEWCPAASAELCRVLQNLS
jgi:hypothetical protein